MKPCPIYQAIERAARARHLTRLCAHVLHKLRVHRGARALSHARLAHAAGCSKATAKRAVVAGRRLGILTAQARFAVGVGWRRRLANAYAFHAPRALPPLILSIPTLAGRVDPTPDRDALVAASRARAHANWKERRAARGLPGA